jgi:hypothetical protein
MAGSRGPCPAVRRRGDNALWFEPASSSARSRAGRLRHIAVLFADIGGHPTVVAIFLTNNEIGLLESEAPPRPTSTSDDVTDIAVAHVPT